VRGEPVEIDQHRRRRDLSEMANQARRMQWRRIHGKAGVAQNASALASQILVPTDQAD
jgi:hypothetical protein